eukprot:TRINITY_DN29609_c0_g1_i2.p1 TRINITY_DN29609_c0_g1~~TRINITY_DN29609_c0_g1_i2.p1  ORF type:complete len:124 (-),score=32.38 TRINITY_DN29609_c0_g1_i2:20-391(-)
MIRRPPRSTQSRSSAASDVYKRQYQRRVREVTFTSRGENTVSDDILNLLESYWQSKCVAGALPSRQDIDPAEIRRLLAHIALIDVIQDGGGFRYRLVGTRVVQQLAYDPTGENLQACSGTCLL